MRQLIYRREELDFVAVRNGLQYSATSPQDTKFLTDGTVFW
jgi:hypothetical protein